MRHILIVPLVLLAMLVTAPLATAQDGGTGANPKRVFANESYVISGLEVQVVGSGIYIERYHDDANGGVHILVHQNIHAKGVTADGEVFPYREYENFTANRSRDYSRSATNSVQGFGTGPLQLGTQSRSHLTVTPGEQINEH